MITDFFWKKKNVSIKYGVESYLIYHNFSFNVKNYNGQCRIFCLQNI
jgi:hypothetical protein